MKKLDVKLTRESRRVLKSVYDIYCDRRKNGASKSSAVRFDDPTFGGPQIDGFDDARQELSNAGFIKCFITGDFDLTDDAIIFMENFTKDSILKWLEFGSNFIP